MGTLLHLAVSSSKASSFTLPSLLSPAPVPRAPPAGSGSDQSQYRSHSGTASMPSMHLKKKISSSVNKSIPMRQAGSLIGVSQLINETLAEASSNISQLVYAKSDIQVKRRGNRSHLSSLGVPGPTDKLLKAINLHPL